ncbi:helix-turn-helix domain-containing protein [Streptomyces sp. NPDC001661]
MGVPARRTGANVHTLRHYERAGLVVSPVDRTNTGRRLSGQRAGASCAARAHRDEPRARPTLSAMSCGQPRRSTWIVASICANFSGSRGSCRATLTRGSPTCRTRRGRIPDAVRPASDCGRRSRTA